MGELGRIIVLVVAAPIGSALLAFLLVGGFGGVAQWWDDLTKHQPLPTQTEPVDQRTVPINVDTGQVTEQPAPLTNEQQ